MNFTILLPHYKTGKMTAFAVHELLRLKGKHKVKVIVINNGGGGIEELARFGKQITILNYPSTMMQSHGIAFDFAMHKVTTDYFITVESDSFPTQENWLDYYEDLANKGVDCAGSLLKLSGGEYIHPAGAMYKRDVWVEAMNYARGIPYDYFPNMSDRGDLEHFAYHLMVKKEITPNFVQDPEFQGIKLHHSYKWLDSAAILAKRDYYLPATGVFHNGMGLNDESISTYGNRKIGDPVYLDHMEPIIHRVGYEPGQWFCYWMAQSGKVIYQIPTETKWLPNRENQQQEYTIMENGFKHLWGVTAYHGCEVSEFKDVIDFKQQQMEELWQTLAK
jgi:hypothetical protein